MKLYHVPYHSWDRRDPGDAGRKAEEKSSPWFLPSKHSPLQ